MNPTNVIKTVMSKKNITQASMARSLGVNQSAISTRLRGTSMSTDSFMKMLNACGWEVVVRDTENPADEIKVTPEVDLDSLL